MSTKQEIFNQALLLFSQRGYDGVSIRDISKAVGIKESSIYNHYAGKKSILDDICARFLQTLSAARPPLEKVEEMLDTMMPVDVFLQLIYAYGHQIDPQITQMAKTFFGEQFRSEELHELFEREFIEGNVTYYVSVLNLMERKGRIRSCDKMLLANLFNNNQMMLAAFQYSGCKTKEERMRLALLMKQSTEYLFQPLEAEP